MGVCMRVEGTRVEPLYCKYVTGTVAGVRKRGSQGDAGVGAVVDAQARCDLCLTCIIHK